MKVRAIANLSGPGGRRVFGEEFVVDAALGQSLIERKLAQEVASAPARAVKDKPAFVSAAKE